MHDYLQIKLKNAKNMIELIPFMESLIKLDELKQNLSATLSQQYKNDDYNHIRSLFISFNGLNDIPCDMVQAKVFSYLPAGDYKMLSLVSKHFQNIMKRHPFIYNEKKYKIKFAFIGRNTWPWCPNTFLSANHRFSEPFLIFGARFPWNDDKPRLINEESFPWWRSMQCWEISWKKCSQGNEQKMQDMLIQSHNVHLIKLISENNKIVRKLTLKFHTNHDDLFHKLFTSENCNFPNCFAFHIEKNMNISNILHNKQ
eukprot:101524_1